MDGNALAPRAQVVGAAIINIAMALWLVGAPHALGYASIEAARWNAPIVGVIVMAIAAVRIWRPASTASLSVVTILLAAWLVMASLVLGGFSWRGYGTTSSSRPCSRPRVASACTSDIGRGPVLAIDRAGHDEPRSVRWR